MKILNIKTISVFIRTILFFAFTFSILNTKVSGITYDYPVNDNLITNKIKVELSAIAESLSDIEYRLYNPKGKEITYLLFQNSPTGEHKKEFSLGTKSDELSQSCIKLINTRRTGICEDGIYKVQIQSTDAPGNRSNVKEIKIERDTVKPAKPIFSKPYICGVNICVNDFFGELNTHLVVNNRNLDIIKAGKTEYIIYYKWDYNKLYNFQIHLKDNAGNLSPTTVMEFSTIGIGVGDGNYKNPWGDKRGDLLSSIKFDVEIDQFGDYKLNNIRIPPPELTYIYTTFFSKKAQIHGVAIPKGHPMVVNIKKRFMSFNEASKECDIGWWIHEEDKRCIENKMGVSDYDSWVWDRKKECWFFSFCIEKKKKTWRKETNDVITKEVQHVMIPFYKNSNSGKTVNFSHIWNDSSDGLFTKIVNLEGEVAVGNEIMTNVTIFGEFTYKGVLINYRGRDSSQIKNNVGILSALSNSLKVPAPPQYPFVSPTKTYCDGARLTSPYGWRVYAGKTSFHDGIDIAYPGGCDLNPIFPGVVVKINNSYGKTVIIEHEFGFKSIYGHHKSINVKKGSKVDQNTKTGWMGMTGYASGIHVHLRIDRQGVTPDPKGNPTVNPEIYMIINK